MSSYKSYCFTVRPTKGVSRDLEKALLSWGKKQKYCFMGMEMNDEARHLHAQVWFDEPRTRGNLNKAIDNILERTLEDYNYAQKVVFRTGTRIAYDDWFLEYVMDAEKKKDDIKNIILEMVPEKTQLYYPSEEEQERVRASCNAIDKRFHRLNEMWKEWEKYEDRPDLENAGLFLNWIIYSEKKYPVIQDGRIAKQVCKNLHAYNRGSMELGHFIGKNDLEEVFRRYDSEKDNGNGQEHQV